MRRFLSYIVMMVALLGIFIFNIQAKTEGVNWSQEFDHGTEVVYNISNGGADVNIDKVVETFGNRLEQAGATNYKVESAVDKNTNNYEVKVVVGSRSSSDVNDILRSVSANGEISVYTANGWSVGDPTSVFKNKSAKKQYDTDSGSNPAPAYLQVEIDKVKMEEIKSHAVDDKDDTGLAGLVVIWQGKPEDVDFTDLSKSSDEFIYENGSLSLTPSQLQSKVLAVLDFSEATSDEEGNSTGGPTAYTKIAQDDKNEDIYYLDFGVYGYSGQAKSSATFNASSVNSYERIFNNDLLDYEVTEVYRRTISADYDAYVNADAKVTASSSSLFVVIGAAVVILALCVYLIIRFRTLAVAGCAGILLTVLFDLFFLNLFNISFNPVGIAAIVLSLVYATNLLCEYFQRVTEDAYKGRVIAKANNEGYRKVISTIVDSTIVLVICGIVLAVVARANVRMFPLFFLISSLVSLICVAILPKLVNNFICGSKVVSKLSSYGIKEKYVADMDGNVKETVPSTLAQKINVKKAGKVSGWVTLGAVIVAVLGTVAFTIFSSNHYPFNGSYDSQYSRIEVRCTDENLFYDNFDGKEYNGTDKNQVENFVAYVEDSLNVKVVKSWSITNEKNPYDLEDKNYIYFYADLDKVVNEDASNIFSEHMLGQLEATTGIASYNQNMVNVYTIDAGTVTGDFLNTFALVGITVGICLVYFVIRYRYTLGLSIGLSSAAAGLISVGLLSITRIPASAYAGVGIVASVLLMNLVLIPLGNRLGQLKNESKVKITTYEQREEIAYSALRSSITGIVVAFVAALLSVIVFAVAIPDMLVPFAVTALSLVICCLISIFVIVPFHLYLERKLTFKKIKARRASRRQAKREKLAKANRNRGAEPEEIIIPGIND